MKKIFLVFLLLSCFTLISCGSKKIVVGTDAAKVLLARERLDENYFNNEGTLFTSGAKSLNRLSNEARRLLQGNQDLVMDNVNVREDNLFKWYVDDINYSNLISFFDSYTTGIESCANQGVERIEYVKKYIRVVGKWVIKNNNQYLLLVEEDSETIFYRSENQYDICKRYVNELGQNVYEIFIGAMDGFAKTRMTYIPGYKYEFSSVVNGSYLYLSASFEKGYWEITSTGKDYNYSNIDSYLVDTLIVKEEAIYSIGTIVYNDHNEFYRIFVIGNERKTDYVTISNYGIELCNVGLDGLSHIEIEANIDEVKKVEESDENTVIYDFDNYYSTTGKKSAIAVLDNGMRLTESDTLLDGMVTVGRIDVSYISDCPSYSKIPLYFEIENLVDVVDVIQAIFDETGLSFTNSGDELFDSILFAIKDSKDFAQYFLWNGYDILTSQSLLAAMNYEDMLIEKWVSIYNEMDKLEVINSSNQEEIDKNINFSTCKIINDGVISNTNLNIIINDYEIKALDTTLFIEEEYVICYGLGVNNEGVISNIIPVEFNVSNGTLYQNTKEFKIKESNSINISNTTVGNYVLVSYIATKDELIRVTKPNMIKGNIEESSRSIDGYINNLYTNESGYICLESIKDKTINIYINEPYTLSELSTIMKNKAYEFGLIEDNDIEYFENDLWVVYENEEIKSGMYRVRYDNGDNSGYVIAYVEI